jgi:predicted nuclease of predicted toxin-antitoxin system
MRFLLDEDLPPAAASGLRERGCDTFSIHELNRRGLSDEDQLAYAKAEDRVFVTYNRRDYQGLDLGYRRRGESHAGILWVVERTIRRKAVGTLIRALLRVEEVYGDMRGLCLPLQAPPAPSEQEAR